MTTESIDTEIRAILEAKNFEVADSPPPKNRAVVIPANDVLMEPVTWLWRGRIPIGHITIIDGDPGVGKSTTSLDLAARASRGDPMPGETIGREPMNVLVMSTEDALSSTIKPRLTAANADMARIFFFSAVLDETGTEVPLTIPDDLETLRSVIVERDIGLIVIDPLVAFFGKETDSNNDKDVRRALRPLFSLLQDTGTTAVGLRHLTKDRSRAAMYRGGGSIGITGQARSAFLAGFDPEDENDDKTARRRILAHVKSNLGPEQKALAFLTINETVFEGVTPIPTSRVQWLGEVATTAEEVSAAQRPHRGPEAYARSEAESVLSQLLADGPGEPRTPKPTSHPKASQSARSGAQRKPWACAQRRSASNGTGSCHRPNQTPWPRSARETVLLCLPGGPGTRTYARSPPTSPITRAAACTGNGSTDTVGTAPRATPEWPRDPRGPDPNLSPICLGREGDHVSSTPVLLGPLGHLPSIPMY